MEFVFQIKIFFWIMFKKKSMIDGIVHRREAKKTRILIRVIKARKLLFVRGFADLHGELRLYPLKIPTLQRKRLTHRLTESISNSKGTDRFKVLNKIKEKTIVATDLRVSWHSSCKLVHKTVA